jgi:hypothetical protein
MQRWERRARRWLFRAEERRARRKASSPGKHGLANARAEEPSVEDEPTVIPLSPGDAPALSADEDGIAIAA